MSLASTAPGLVTQTEGYRRAALVFDEAGTVDAYLRFESALATVEGGLGIIPAEAVDPILAACRREHLDLEALRGAAAKVGYPIVPLVTMLADIAGEHGQWIHFGTTTQDVMDTAQVLQLREALIPALAAGGRAEQLLVQLCELHKRTPMAGRSKLQHGVPITFGYKVAVWLDQIRRTRMDLSRALNAASVLQFGGALGTLSALGTDGIEVRRRLALQLALSEPDISWHAGRDRMVGLASAMAALLAALAKMAVDIAHLMSTEVGELREPAAAGRGSSSTMPQKRNPVICEAIIEAARSVQHAPATVLDAMLQEHERGIGQVYRERAVLSEATQLLCGSLSLVEELLSGLEVDRTRMAANLNLTDGLIYTEALMIQLSGRMGRIEAHRVLHEVSRRVNETGAALGATLLEVTGIEMSQLDLGVDSDFQAEQDMIDRVLDACAESRQAWAFAPAVDGALHQNGHAS